MIANVKEINKLLLGNLFAVDRIFYGLLRPEDIQDCIVIHEN